MAGSKSVAERGEGFMNKAASAARRRSILTLLTWVTVAGCGAAGASAGGPVGGANAGGPGGPPPPAGGAVSEQRWGHPMLSVNQIPAVYVEEWQKAENRLSCALIAPASLGEGADATPRAATFSGGWAVAYDRPGLRSAFGVAGSGGTTSGEIYSGWTNRREWPDGSFVEYGPEAGQGPNELAYLRVAGQSCLYNVWSRLGRAHLELLLDQLRRVNLP